MQCPTLDNKIKKPFDLKSEGYVLSSREKAAGPGAFFVRV
jgi:hypothetical protein